MDSVVGSLFKDSMVFHIISGSCSREAEVSYRNEPEIFIVCRRSSEIWTDSSYRQISSVCLKPVLKFYMSIEESFISLVRGSFVLLKRGYQLRQYLFFVS